MSRRCPKPKIPWLGTHTMRLERSEGAREVWRCVGCGQTEVRPNPTATLPRCPNQGTTPGPICCLPFRHGGMCRFKCCEPSCPGLPFPASERSHPCGPDDVTDELPTR